MSHKEEQPKPESKGFVESLLGFPRMMRIVLAGVFALAVTLALSPIIDQLYLAYFFSEDTLMLPSLVAGGLGILMYVAGWFLLVGFVGEDRTSSWMVILYLLIGVLAIVLVLIWAARLVIMGSLS
jgi:hypothetical protein